MATASFIDVLLNPVFAVFVLLLLIAVIVLLVMNRKRKILPTWIKGILIAVIVLCGAYLIFAGSLVFLFDSAPAVPPEPYMPQ